MRSIDGLMRCIPILILILLPGCIHDYPHPVKGSSQKGENPNLLSASIEVSYNLSWENIVHHVEVTPSTKARPERPHRFIIEVVKDGEVVSRDLEYLSAEEFALGKLSHKVSVNLDQSTYLVAVWYDMQTDEGDFPFSTESLKDVKINNFSTTNVEIMQCAYAKDILDLSDIEFFEKERVVTKEIELQHPGARFEIIATDVKQFISNFHNAMLMGESFSVMLSFSDETPDGFNLHSESLTYNIDGNIIMTGRLRLPYDDYDELKIAEGFIFCDSDRDVTLSLGVRNSSLVTVSQTDYFNFPVKRGYVTSVYGDFLSNMIDGIFSIDNIWEGEIVIEI